MAEAGGAEPGKPPPVASLERALDQVCDFLSRAEQTARVRALVIEARRLRNVVGNWRSIAPDTDVREEMIARVLRLANDAEDVVAAERGNSAPTEEAAGNHPGHAQPIRRPTPAGTQESRHLSSGLRLGPTQPHGAQGAASNATIKTPLPNTAMFLAGLAAQNELANHEAAPERPVHAVVGRHGTEVTPVALGHHGGATAPEFDLGATITSPAPFDAAALADDAGLDSATSQTEIIVPGHDHQAMQLGRVLAPPARDVPLHQAPAGWQPNERVGTTTATFASPPSLILDRSALPPLPHAPAPAQPPPPAAPDRAHTGTFPSPPSLVLERVVPPATRDVSSRGAPTPAPNFPDRFQTGTFPSPPSLVFERVVPPPTQNRSEEVVQRPRSPEDTFESPPSLHIENFHPPSDNADGFGPGSELGIPAGPDAIRVRSVPLPESLSPHIVMISAPYSAQADAYRTLRRKLSAGTARAIAVTSASASEGKTSCALNLALALRETVRGRILVVEANIRAPSIASTLKFDPPRCFMDQLQRHRDDRLSPWLVVEPAAPTVAVQPSDEPGDASAGKGLPPGARVAEPRPSALAPVHILAINPRSERPPMLDSVAFSMGMESFKRAGYAYIIVDCPPVLGAMDMNVVGDSVDGVLLTSFIKKSSRKSLRLAIEQLRPAPVLGVVLLES